MNKNHLMSNHIPPALAENYDELLTSPTRQALINSANNSSTPNASIFAQSAEYVVRVKTGNSSKHSGTDSTVYMMMFGPNGNSNSFRYNDPSGSDDFQKNEQNSMTLTSAQGSLGGNIGAPFALQVWIDTNDSHDGWELEDIEVTYTSGSSAPVTRTFTFGGWFAKAGDRGVGHRDRWGAVLWAEGLHNVRNSTLVEQLADGWVVIDNRDSDQATTYTAQTEISFNASSFYSHRHTQSHELHYGFAVTKKGGLFGANYHVAVEHTYTNEEEKVHSYDLAKGLKQIYPISVTAQPGQLLFRRLRILGEVGAIQSMKVGEDVLDILDQSFTGMALNQDTAIEMKTFGPHDNIDDGLQRLYEAVFGHPFEVHSAP